MKVRSIRSIQLRRWAMLLFLLPLLSACGQGAGNNHEGVTTSIDPPPTAIEQAMLQGTATTSNSQAKDMVTVYLFDRSGYLAPMSLRADDAQTSSQSSIDRTIALMTVNKQLEDQLPPGFTAVLPAGTKISSIHEDQSGGTITLDFAAPFPGVIAKQERKVIEALVWTLTERPGINKVKLSVAGKPIQSLPTSGLPVDTTLTRGLGINLEMSKDVQINRSMAVTLYFSAQTDTGDGYFVPVTRLINRQADPAKAALEQLIIGPQKNTPLHAVLTSDMTIENLSLMADTINVSLQTADWMPQSPVPSEMMEALVLTLTEATNMPQVRVVMNGDDSFVDSDQQSYEYPVTRPLPINAINR